MRCDCSEAGEEGLKEQYVVDFVPSPRAILFFITIKRTWTMVGSLRLIP